MVIPKIIKNTSLLLGGVFLLIQSCKNVSSKIVFNISKSATIADFKSIDANSRIFVFGAHFISFAKEIKFMSCLTTQDTLQVYSVTNGELLQKIKLPQKAFGISSRDSCIYIFYENGTQYQKIIFVDSMKAFFQIQPINYLPVFNDSFFVSTFANTNIHVLDNGNLLLPYRKQNETHNLTDTFSYILLNMNSQKEAFKLAKYPEQSKFDYLFKTISEYDYNKNNFIYSFQKSNTIHVANIVNKTEETFDIPKLKTIDFPKSELRNISFTRRYLKQNDKIVKILVNSNSDIFVIVKFSSENKFKYRVYFYHTSQRKLYHTDINSELLTDMAFIKHNTLYVPNEEKSYTIFNINYSLLPTGK